MLFLMALTSLAFSQRSTWQLSSVQVGLALEYDRYNEMSFDRLSQFAVNEEDLGTVNSNFSAANATQTGSGAWMIHMSFSPVGESKINWLMDREIRIGLGFHTAKEAMVSFRNEQLDTSVVFCNLHEGMSFEGSYLVKGKFGKKRKWNWYAGLGWNGSASFNNQMVVLQGRYFAKDAHPTAQIINEDQTVRFNAKPVLYNRVFMPYGIHYQVAPVVSIGIDMRTGYGVQTVVGGGSQFIRKTGQFMISTRFSFRN
jgi:hypothetical protein